MEIIVPYCYEEGGISDFSKYGISFVIESSDFLFLGCIETEEYILCTIRRRGSDCMASHMKPNDSRRSNSKADQLYIQAASIIWLKTT